jgi:hypothetical protein
MVPSSVQPMRKRSHTREAEHSDPAGVAQPTIVPLAWWNALKADGAADLGA